MYRRRGGVSAAYRPPGTLTKFSPKSTVLPSAFKCLTYDEENSCGCAEVFSHCSGLVRLSDMLIRVRSYR